MWLCLLIWYYFMSRFLVSGLFHFLGRIRSFGLKVKGYVIRDCGGMNNSLAGNEWLLFQVMLSNLNINSFFGQLRGWVGYKQIFSAFKSEFGRYDEWWNHKIKTKHAHCILRVVINYIKGPFVSISVNNGPSAGVCFNLLGIEVQKLYWKRLFLFIFCDHKKHS